MPANNPAHFGSCKHQQRYGLYLANLPACPLLRRKDIFVDKSLFEQLKGNDIRRVVYSWSGDLLAKDRHLTLVGNYAQISVSCVVVKMLSILKHVH